MSFYSRNLKYYANRISNVRRSSVRIRPQSSDSASASQTTTILCPANIITNLSQMSLHFTCTPASTDATDVVCVPASHQLIDRVAVEIGGQTISNISNYGEAYTLLMNLTSSPEKAEAQQPTHNVAPLAFRHTTAGAYDADEAARARDLVCDNWLGFQDCSPEFISTQLLPDILIRITWKPASVIYSHNAAEDGVAAGTVSYECSNIVAVFDTLEINDGVYDAMLQTRLMSGEPLEIPFGNVITNTGAKDGSTGTFRTTASSKSIDKVITAVRATDFQTNSVGNHLHIQAASQTALVATASGNNSGFGLGGLAGNHYKFEDRGINSWYYMVDSQRYPAFNVDTDTQTLQQARSCFNNNADFSQGDLLCRPISDAYGSVGGNQGDLILPSNVNDGDTSDFRLIPLLASQATVNPSITHFKDFKWVACMSLEHETEDSDRAQSGLNSEGASTQLQFVYSGSSGETGEFLQLHLMTSSLLVYPDRVVELVQ